MTQWQSGKNSDAKKIMLRLPPETGDDELYSLNRAQVKVLITLSQTIGWMSRHIALPSYADTQEKLTDLADETALDLMSPVDFCSQLMTCEEELEAIIASLLGTSDTIHDSLMDMLGQSDDFKELVRRTASGSSGSQTGGELTDGCDPAKIAGELIQLIDRLDTNNVDFLEIVEVGTNDEENVANLLQAIPGLGESPADEIIDFGQGLLATFTENYLAAVTSSWKIEVVEDLFCIATSDEDCKLTFEQVFNYFQTRSGSSLSLTSAIRDIVHFVINGDFDSDDLIASGMFAVQLAFIVAGRDFYGLNIPTIGALMRDADESTAYEDFDECPVAWCKSFVNSDLHSVFTPSGGLGEQALWDGSAYGANTALINSRITLEADLGSMVTVDDVTVIYDGNPPTAPINSVTMYTDNFVSIIQSATWIEETLLDIDATNIQVFELDTVSSFDTSVPITRKIVEIRVRGHGTPPSVGVDC